MIKNILTIAFITLPISAFAQSNFDDALLRDKLINSKFEIINSKEFDKLLRDTTNQVSRLIPMKVDADTTLLSMNFSRFGIYANYHLEEVETKADAEIVMYKFNLANDFKNYICSSELAQSQTFKKLNSLANINLLNSKNEIIFNLKIPLKQC